MFHLWKAPSNSEQETEKKVQSPLGTGTHLQNPKETGITKSDLSNSTIGLEAYHVEDWNAVATAVVYDKSIKAIRVKVPGTTEEFYLHPATVRRNDKSAKSIVLTSFLEFRAFHCIDRYKSKSTMPMFANTSMIYRVSLPACYCLNQEVDSSNTRKMATWSPIVPPLLRFQILFLSISSVILKHVGRIYPAWLTWMSNFWEQDEWSGEQKLRYTDVAENVEPESIRPMGNYAVSINWPDGFSQVNIEYECWLKIDAVFHLCIQFFLVAQYRGAII